jgi:hypothetical protein
MIIAHLYRKRLLGAAALAALLGTAGCASVKPYEKEHLADPLMSDRYAAEGDMHEMKWLDAREGSTGGGGGAGGGCACK